LRLVTEDFDDGAAGGMTVAGEIDEALFYAQAPIAAELIGQGGLGVYVE